MQHAHNAREMYIFERVLSITPWRVQDYATELHKVDVEYYATDPYKVVGVVSGFKKKVGSIVIINDTTPVCVE